jgi:hypothetical protein
MLLSAWLGAGVLFAAVVAPAAFATLPSRTLAGAMVGRVLPVLFVAGIAVSLIGIVLDRSSAGVLPRVRRASLIVVAVACAVAQFGVAPRIERVREEIDGPVEQLSRDDPRRIAFGRLHASSVAWLGLAMLSAAATVVLASISPRSQRSRARTDSLGAMAH